MDELLAQLEPYLNSCLMEQPEWIRKMFKLRRVVFTLGEAGMGVMFKRFVKKEKKVKLIDSIGEWLKAHPIDEMLVLDDDSMVH
jgi:hypothetical protein